MLRRVHENDAHSYQVQFMSNKHNWNMLEYGYTWLNRQKTWVPYDPTEVLGCTVCHGARTICLCQLCLSPGIICRLTWGVGRLLSSKTKWFSGLCSFGGWSSPSEAQQLHFQNFKTIQNMEPSKRKNGIFNRALIASFCIMFSKGLLDCYNIYALLDHDG